MEMIRHSLCALIQEGWTQSEIASKAGVSQASVSRILSGQGTPRTSSLEKLHDFLGCPEVQSCLGEDFLAEGDVRKAVRLYKHLKTVTSEGGQLVLRQEGRPDKMLFILF